MANGNEDEETIDVGGDATESLHDYIKFIYAETHKGLIFTISASGVLAGILMSTDLLSSNHWVFKPAIVGLQILVGVVTICVGYGNYPTIGTIKKAFEEINSRVNSGGIEDFSKLIIKALHFHAAICYAIGIAWLIAAIVYISFLITTSGKPMPEKEEPKNPSANTTKQAINLGINVSFDVGD